MNKPEVLSELGARLRDLRVGLELKQADLADRAAVNRNTVLAVENGRPVTT